MAIFFDYFERPGGMAPLFPLLDPQLQLKPVIQPFTQSPQYVWAFNEGQTLIIFRFILWGTSPYGFMLMKTRTTKRFWHPLMKPVLNTVGSSTQEINTMDWADCNRIE